MIGQTLGHYCIVEKIGEGGMGVVYRAHDERLDRDVALKVLPAGTLADEAARRRFRKEALALSKLNHPNIETVHDFDTQDGIDFLVMEYVPGITLHEKVASGCLPEKEIARLGAQMAEGLAAAHNQGVVHRDLKPANLRVTPDGRLKILDFGVAKLLQPKSDAQLTQSVTETHEVAGTLPYMAPEQLRGEPTDARTDIHAVGALLYELATGKRAFREELATRLAEAILHELPASPRALNPRVSAELERITLKCLDKDPENRYQSAQELSVDLRRLGVPITTAVAATVPSRISQYRAAAISGMALVALLAVLFALNVGGWRERLLGRSPAPQVQSLAVLPLEDLSHDPEQEYFADGMTDALIADLGKIGALRVISRGSVMRYKGTQKPLQEIARELNVDAVIMGSVLRSGQRVRITPQLIDAATDRVLWSENYEGDLRDILALQSEVARAIGSEIRLKLAPPEQARLGRSRAVNPEAYEAYLKGRYYSNKLTEGGVNKGIEYFKRAIEIDPTYALAYAGLADAYYGLSNIYLPPKKVMPKAEAAAIKALEVDDTLAEAHTSLGMVRMYYDWNWLDAEREFKRAIELNPNYATVHLRYGLFLTQMGRFNEAIAELKWAQRLDPFSIEGNAFTGLHFIFARQYKQAVEELLKAIEMEPNSWIAHDFLASAYELRGELARAIAAFQTARRLDDNPTTLAKLGHAYLAWGKRGEGIKILNQVKELSKQRYVSPYFIAMLYMGLGDKDQVFEWLEKTYEDRNEMLGWLKVDPVFDTLRSEGRYQDLLRRIGLPP